MFPSFSLSYKFNTGSGNVIFGGNNTLTNSPAEKFCNLKNLLFFELGVANLFSAELPSLSHFIQNVPLVRGKKKMFRINARWVVALMATMKTFRNGVFVKFKRYTISPFRFSARKFHCVVWVRITSVCNVQYATIATGLRVLLESFFSRLKRRIIVTATPGTEPSRPLMFFIFGKQTRKRLSASGAFSFNRHISMYKLSHKDAIGVSDFSRRVMA